MYKKLSERMKEEKLLRLCAPFEVGVNWCVDNFEY